MELTSDVIRVKGFRWMPGMLALHVGTPLRVVSVENDEYLGEPYQVLRTVRENGEPAQVIAEGETFPDLTDPATGGWLLALLDENAHYIEHSGANGELPWGAWWEGIRTDFQHLGEACAFLAIKSGSFAP